MRTIVGFDVVACSLHDLLLADMPIEHSFTLAATTPICNGSRRLLPKNNEVVMCDLVTNRDAGAVTPSLSEWCFLCSLIQIGMEPKIPCGLLGHSK